MTLIGCPCFGSLHPLFVDSDVIFDTSIIGVWQYSELTHDGRQRREYPISIQGYKNGQDNDATKRETALPRSLWKQQIVPGYLIVDKKPGAQAEEDDTCNTIFYIVEIDGELFLDIAAKRPAEGPFVPLHWFAHIDKEDKIIRVKYLDGEWLTEHLAHHPKALDYEVVPIAFGEDAGLLITAKPQELQTFLHKHLNDPDAWILFAELKRE